MEQSGLEMASDINRSCVVGHRGAGNLAPGSTFAAFNKAVELDLSWVEFDVRLTADSRLVVSNSDDLSEFVGYPLKISESEYSDISAIDVAQKFQGECEPQKIPLFEEVLNFCKKHGLHTQIELKAEAGKDRKLADAVIDVLEKPDFHFSADKKPLITSFSPVCLQAVHERMGTEIETGLLVHTHLAEDWKILAEQAAPDYVHFYGGTNENGQRLIERFADAVRSEGYKLNAYKVNTLEDARSALKVGVHRFTSDEPLRLLDNT